MIDALTSALFSALLEPTDPPATAGGLRVAQTVTGGDAAVLKRAATLLAELQAGTIDRNELSTDLSAEYTKTVLSETQKTLPSGEPETIVQIRKNRVGGDTTYVFRVKWAQGTLDYTFSFDDTTFEIVKLYFRTGPPN